MTTVFVTVGTDHHPFNRLVEWAASWAIDKPDIDLIVQHGPARAPGFSTNFESMPKFDLLAMMKHADIIVAQGGPGGIIEANRLNKRPIVVARTKALGEAVDDHQLAFTRHMDVQGYVRAAETERDFQWAMDYALTNPCAYRVWRDTSHAEKTVAKFSKLIDGLLP